MSLLPLIEALPSSVLMYGKPQSFVPYLVHGTAMDLARHGFTIVHIISDGSDATAWAGKTADYRANVELPEASQYIPVPEPMIRTLDGYLDAIRNALPSKERILIVRDISSRFHWDANFLSFARQLACDFHAPVLSAMNCGMAPFKCNLSQADTIIEIKAAMSGIKVTAKRLKPNSADLLILEGRPTHSSVIFSPVQEAVQ